MHKVSRTFTFKIALGNLLQTERTVVFYMPWRGCREVYWIVPLSYVVSMKMIQGGFIRLQITQAFFEVPTGPTGWQRDWERHLSQ